jgi:uncharacterized protein (DUF169 family)
MKPLRPLQTDLSIFKKFEFEHAPVGIKFLYHKPEGLEPLNKTISFCQMFREAQARKSPFYMTKDNDDCLGKLLLGMEGEFPVFGHAGEIGAKYEYFQEARANQRIYYQHPPMFLKGTVNYVAYSPLDTLTFEPDLLMLMATPSQAEIVLRAMSYSTGALWESKVTGVFACAWMYAYPYQTGKVNYTITGMSFGMKAKEILPPGWVLMSIPWDVLPMIAQNLKEMKWVLPSYTDGREKFYERRSKVLQECVEEAQNP